MSKDPDYAKMTEEVYAFLNEVRKDPSSILPELKKMKKFYKDKEYRNPAFNYYIMTEEGISAVDDAIKHIETSFTQKLLERHEGLEQAAKELIDHLGPEGLTTAKDADLAIEKRVKSKISEPGAIAENLSFGWPSAKEIILQMIIDDGVPSRGHRTNLLSGNYERVGIAVGKHKTFQCICAIEFWGKGKKENLKFDNYEIDKDQWPSDAIGLEKHLEAKTEGDKRKILLTYTFTLVSGDKIVKTREFIEDA